MTATAALQTSSTLLAQLANPAARALALGAAAGLGLAAFRVKVTSTRLFTWTAVLYAALAMPLLGWMLPPVSIATPAFLQQALNTARDNETVGGHHETVGADSEILVATAEQSSPRVAAERRQNAAHGASRGNVAIGTNQPQRGERSTLAHTNAPLSRIETPPTNAPPASLPSISGTVLASAIYLAVASIFLARFLIGLAYGRRLIHTSQTIDDPLVIRKLALTTTPRLAESELISVPVTMGALRPTILLPAGWREWSLTKLDAVLAHELSHVARRDPLTQRLSLLPRAIFWFSPLAWFLDRRLADLAEQASDEAALSCGTDRKHYARILLDFFEALNASPGRVWWQGVSMAKAGQAEKRVERILTWKGSVAMHLKKSILVVVALAIPVVYLAASAHPAQHVPMLGAQFAQDQTPPAQQSPAPKSQPATTPAPAIASTPDETTPPESSSAAQPTPAPAPAAGISGGVSGTAPVAPRASMAVPTNPPNPALAPIAPVAPVGRLYRSDPQGHLYKAQAEAQASAMRARSMADQSANSHSSYGSGNSYTYGYDDDQRFVIVTGKSDSLTMSGSTADARHVEKLRKSIPGDFIWFQVDEKSYIIRDQATIDRARKLWAPQEELGKKQEELGKQQEALGKQQEELGDRMEKVRVNVPDMTAQLDKLKAELKALGSTATMDQIGKVQEEMGELQEKMGDIQSHAGDQQGKLGEEMGALGEKQGKLGEQQGELGRQQAELAEKASHEMKLLLEDAVKKGLAQPEL
jgi:beta-lactamase regulating signal transducer with metallopeptidase domain